jgi:RNA polymerase sigma factor (sigma-70 family)
VLRYVHRQIGVPETEASDADLLARFATCRDEAAFELLLRRHGSMVLKLARDATRDVHAAEDVLQAVFFTLARHASAIRQGRSLGAWLYKTAYRIALRARSPLAVARNQSNPSIESFGRAAPPPLLDICTREMHELLHEEVQRLPTKYCAPIVLCYFEGLTHAEAASKLGWPKGTVAARVARARALLHKRLLCRGVALPAALIAMTTDPAFSSATCSGSLIQNTLRGGLRIAAGAVASDVSPPHVAKLMRLAFSGTMPGKAKFLMLVAMVGLALAGGISLAPARPDETTERPPDAKAALPDQVTENIKPAHSLELDGKLSSFALAPDGQRYAAGGNTLATGMPQGRFAIVSRARPSPLLAKSTTPATCIAFSPDGSRLATGTSNGETTLWETATGREIATVREKSKEHRIEYHGRFQSVYGLSFIDDSTLAIAVSYFPPGNEGRDQMREVEIWDLATTRKKQTLSGAEAALASSKDGKRLATGTMDWTVRIWDVQSGKPFCTLDGHENPTRFLGFNRHGDEVVTGSQLFEAKSRVYGCEIKVWDLSTAKPKSAAKIASKALISCGAISPDGRFVALGSSKQDSQYYYGKSVPSVTLVQAATGKIVATFALIDEKDAVEGVAFSADGKSLGCVTAGVSTCSAACIWDISQLTDAH